MPELINQAVESFTQIPDGLEHPLQTAAVVGGAAVALVVQGVRYHLSSEKQAAAFSNPALLEASVRPNRTLARRSRMLPLYGVLAGSGFIAANLLGNPTYDTEAANHDANVVVVQDESFSMLNTRDLGEPNISRAQAVEQAVNTSDYHGNFGVVQAGANSRIITPLSKRQPVEQGSRAKAEVDPNGGQLVQAMDLAASLFPTSTSHKTASSNTEVVITDGTIEDSTDAIAAEVVKLQKQGITVKIVVPGTAKGTYTLPGNTVPISSGAEVARFAKVSNSNVVEVKNVAEVTTAIHKDIRASGITHNKHKWLVPGVLGVLLAGAGILTDQVQRPRRVV